MTQRNAGGRKERERKYTLNSLVRPGAGAGAGAGGVDDGAHTAFTVIMFQSVSQSDGHRRSLCHSLIIRIKAI